MGETSEALFLTSGFAYDDAATVAARFAGEAEGMTYAICYFPEIAYDTSGLELFEKEVIPEFR